VHDPGEAPANTYAAPHGLTRAEVLAAVERIASRLPVAAAVLAAYDPAVDPEGPHRGRRHRPRPRDRRHAGADIGQTASPARDHAVFVELARSRVVVALLALLVAPAARAQTSGCGTENLLAGLAPSAKQEVAGNAALVTDGAVGNEGTQWDAPVAVTMGAQGSLTYDLGQLRPVGALYVQADANDTYRVLGSPDGTPGSFRLLAEIPNVIDRGHGLRYRTIELAPASVRYLRFGEGNGDGFYSISEFAAYCKAPSPFPPAFKTTDAPLAQAPAPAAPLDGRDGESNGLFALLAVVALALLAGGYALSREPASWRALSADGALRLIFVASGAAALIYEVVWFHLLRLVIGASALSVAIVLASFMGGMFIGSLFFARFVRDERHPLQVYAFLELGIGACGLLMPLVLPVVRFVYVGLVGYGAVGIALRALIAALLLCPPRR
jgi:hypothetical protein